MNLATLIRQGAIRRGLDPRAVLAVASVEGLGGGVGDHGHAFGAFQLNDAGGVLTGRPGNHRAFAESPAGIAFALDRIAQVARGQRGGQAVNSIVRQFERPADPNGEVQRALAHYGGNVGSIGGGAAPGPSLGGPARRTRSGGNLAGLAALIGSTNQLVGLDQSPALGSLLTAGSVSAPRALSGRAPALAPPSRSGARGRIAELLKEGTGGPTHSTGPHIHVASTNPRTLLGLISLARQLGLHVGENPYVGSVAPVHSRGSYHYRTFPGRYNGRPLGEAIDVTGPQMNAYYDLVRRRYGRP